MNVTRPLGIDFSHLAQPWKAVSELYFLESQLQLGEVPLVPFREPYLKMHLTACILELPESGYDRVIPQVR